MEKDEYSKFIMNNELSKLADVNVQDLIKYEYQNKYLIEYLLEAGIHTPNMDDSMQYSSRLISFYLKYNIVKPLLKCRIKPLLETINNELLLDKLLQKLNNDERMELYHNLKENSYWEFRNHETEIIELYANYGIKLPQVFTKKRTILDSNVSQRKKDEKLLNEFKKVFSDTNSNILNIYLHEFKKRLSIDNKRAKSDIQKLINYKSQHQEFVLKLSDDTEGEYSDEFNTMAISAKRHGILTHELSHLMYDKFDDMNNDVLVKYEEIRTGIDNTIVIDKIAKYLKKFHENYSYIEHIFEELYYHEIKKTYGNYNAYIKAICEDIYTNHTNLIAIKEAGLYFYIDEHNIHDIVAELLIIEKKEFVTTSTRNYYNEELMLENLLDALLKGKICDGKLNIDCLSGHIGRDFMEDDDLSFDECLADYYAIKNSIKSDILLKHLEKLVGSDLIMFLDNYLEKNRGLTHGI